MVRAYPPERPVARGDGAPDVTGPRSAARSSGALVGRRRGRQFFLAGTAVGSAGFAARARVTRAVVAFAGAFFAAGLLFLAGVAFATGFGASTASSAVALVVSAA